MPMKKPILITGVIAILLLALLSAVLLFPQSTDESPEVTDTPNVQVLFDTNHTDEVEKLTFTGGSNNEISLSKGEGGWQITGRPGLPVSEEAMAALLSPLSQMLALRTVTEECTDLSEYGLDTPVLKVSLSAHGETKTYLFGDENSYYEGYYCMVEGTSAVYILDVSYVTAFDVAVEDLLATEVLPALSAITSLTFTGSSGNALRFDPADLAEFIGVLSTLSVDRLIDYGSEQYEVYGFDNAAELSADFIDGSSLTIRLSEGESEELIYLVIGDRELIYLVSCQDMDTLLKYIRM